MKWLKFAPLIFYGIELVERTIKDKGDKKQASAVSHIERTVELSEGLEGKKAAAKPEVVKALKVAIDAVIAYENTMKKAYAKESGQVPESESEAHPD
jgi:hypothetical protein